MNRNKETHNGHEWVDLGLPSGTLWATCNVGANLPEEYGDYFAWGETTPKSCYDWSTYKYGTDYNQLTKYCSSRGLWGLGRKGFRDNKTVLDASDDAATANWGNGWRMPTWDEIEELYSKCSSVWTIQNGVKGRLFKGPNGNTLFLPAAGRYGTSRHSVGSDSYYWSSTLSLEGGYDANRSYEAYGFGAKLSSSHPRYKGYSVRPVVANQNPEPNAAYLSLSISQKSIEAVGGEFSVGVTSNKAWSVSCGQLWVTISATSGSGNGFFSVLVAANESHVADIATITVTEATGNATHTLTITRQGQPQGDGTLQGHIYVDLGLPSGTLWATCNVGANLPEEYGDYFAWGETDPKSDYSWKTYKYADVDYTLTKYCDNSSSGTDNKTVLDAEDDAATAKWGSGWRMPTLDEFEELVSKCTSVWTTQNGVKGRLFTASNGNTLFLPAAGFSGCYGSPLGAYWSSNRCELVVNPGAIYIDCYDGSERCEGLSVRPVVVNLNAAYLSLSVSQKLFGAVGGDVTVSVTSNRAWSVSCAQPWVTLSAMSGLGDGSFSVRVASNESHVAGNATITVTTATGNVTQTIAISRQGKPQGVLQGHDYVDLGLPSGTLWATCNVGADSPKNLVISSLGVKLHRNPTTVGIPTNTAQPKIS